VSGIDIHQLAAAYALDALDDRERAEFEAHYPTCPVCRPEVTGTGKRCRTSRHRSPFPRRHL
jgi:anti-sigma factor RsiW